VKSITGHSTDEMVKHYGKKVNQRKLAKAEIEKLVEAVLTLLKIRHYSPQSPA
jgi:ABC-type Fe3+/spermidine/putrescine transport system ATPase subunit